jgi:hypothetical protein
LGADLVSASPSGGVNSRRDRHHSTAARAADSKISVCKHLDSSRGADLRPSKQEESGDYMKLWKCDPYLLDTKGFVLVVVMAETRQQAIEKPSARLLEVLGHVFPDDDYQRFAQLGSDNLDNTIEEVPDEVVISIVEPPSVARDLA